MSVLSFLNSALDVGLVVSALLFIVVYTRIARWRETIVGRSLLLLFIAIALIPTPRVLTLVFGFSAKSDLYTLVEVICKVPAVLAVLWCLFTLIRVQRSARPVPGETIQPPEVPRS